MVFERGFIFLKTTVIYDPIDRMWIPGGFQPSVHSETASSTIFYLWVWKMTFLFLKIPGFYLLQDGYIYMYTSVFMYVHVYIHICMHLFVHKYTFLYTCICICLFLCFPI